MWKGGAVGINYYSCIDEGGGKLLTGPLFG